MPLYFFCLFHVEAKMSNKYLSSDITQEHLNKACHVLRGHDKLRDMEIYFEAYREGNHLTPKDNGILLQKESEMAGEVETPSEPPPLRYEQLSSALVGE